MMDAERRTCSAVYEWSATAFICSRLHGVTGGGGGLSTCIINDSALAACCVDAKLEIPGAPCAVGPLSPTTWIIPFRLHIYIPIDINCLDLNAAYALRFFSARQLMMWFGPEVQCGRTVITFESSSRKSVDRCRMSARRIRATTRITGESDERCVISSRRGVMKMKRIKQNSGIFTARLWLYIDSVSDSTGGGVAVERRRAAILYSVLNQEL